MIVRHSLYPLPIHDSDALRNIVDDLRSVRGDASTKLALHDGKRTLLSSLAGNALNFTTRIVRRNLEDFFQLWNKLPPRPLRINMQSPPSLADPEGYPLF